MPYWSRLKKEGYFGRRISQFFNSHDFIIIPFNQIKTIKRYAQIPNDP